MGLDDFQNGIWYNDIGQFPQQWAQLLSPPQEMWNQMLEMAVGSFQEILEVGYMDK